MLLFAGVFLVDSHICFSLVLATLCYTVWLCMAVYECVQICGFHVQARTAPKVKQRYINDAVFP